MELQDLGVDLEQEGYATGFLGVTLEQYPKKILIDMKLTGLIKLILEAFGLDDVIPKGKFTPSGLSPWSGIRMVNHRVKCSAK